MNILKKAVRLPGQAWTFLKQTFKGVTFKEVTGAARDTARDIMKSRREALTFFVFCFTLPTPSGLVYMSYRLRQHRARIGVIDAKPDPLLSEERYQAILSGIRAAPRRVPAALGRAAKWLAPRTAQTAGAALALGGAGLSTHGLVQSFRNPAVINYSLLEQCNKALAKKQVCTPAAAAEKAKSQMVLRNLGEFGLGGIGIGAGVMLYSASRRRPKK